MEPSLPLRYRLPNPPPVFVGRERERSRLVAALERAPLAVVWGLGGLGKSALVVQAIRTAFPARAERTLLVSMRPGQPGRLLLEAVRALAAARALSGVDWSDLSRDPERLLATAVDLAEQGGLWVVLDDLHHGDPDEVRQLLRGLATYARQSRWIATSRHDPELPELAAQLLPLGAMTRGELAALAHHQAPDLDTAGVERAVSAAAGSPWRLGQALYGRDPTDSETGDLLFGLSPTERELVLALTIPQVPIGLQTMARIAALPSDDALDALKRRGLLERAPGRLRLHDVASGLLEAGQDGEAAARWTRRIAEVLVHSEEPAEVVEGLRLWLRENRADEARRLLDERGEWLFHAGYASHVWQFLARRPEPALALWRLRAAVEFGGGGAALRWAADAAPATSREERLLQAQACFLDGRPSEAASLAERLLDEALAAGQRPLALEAMFLQARCERQLHRGSAMLAALGRVPPASDDERCRLDVQRARALVLVGRIPEALEITDALAALLPSIGHKARREVEPERAAVYFDTGRLHAASEALRAAGAGGGTHLESYFHLQGQLVFALFGGRLQDAERLLARFDTFAIGRLYSLSLRIAAGSFAGIADACEAVLRALGPSGSSQAHWSALVCRIQVAMLCAEQGFRGHLAAREPSDGDVALRPLAVYGMRYALRWDASPASIRTDPLPDAVDLQIVVRIAAAEAALVSGKLDLCRKEALAAVALARAYGWALLEADAWQVLCDCAAAAGEHEELRSHACELESLAASFPSPRYLAETRFYRTICDGKIDPAVLGELAALEHLAPVAARRARAWQGSDAALDALDRLVLRAVRPRAAEAGVEWVALGGGACMVGLERARKAVWLPGNRRLDLAHRQLLWRIVVVLVQHGGDATKETLVREAWGLRDYHPIRDDGRLHVAVGRLRQLLKEHASNAVQLQTTDSGYRFGSAD